MSAAILAFPEQIIRPDLPAVWKVLETVAEDDIGAQFDLALAMLKLVERARDTPMVTTAIDQRRVMSMLTIAFLAIAGCVGIPRGEAMGAISDNGQEGGPPAA